jgi:hypothetical protein
VHKEIKAKIDLNESNDANISSKRKEKEERKNKNISQKEGNERKWNHRT